MVALENFFEITAILACGMFTGAAVYINLVEHPARMNCGARLAVTEFGPSYRRAAVMQASLAVIGFLTATAAWLMGASRWWLVGGIILVSVVPYTLVAIMPTNKELLNPDLDKDSVRAHRLLKKWNQLHTVRSLLSFIAFLVFVLAR
jgi:hypothetical protein